MELTATIECPLEGFEGVSVTYNMMATEAEADQFSVTAGRHGSHEPVVLKVDGWPVDKYGPDPWNYEKAPMAFRVWAARKGFGAAVREFLNDPN